MCQVRFGLQSGVAVAAVAVLMLVVCTHGAEASIKVDPVSQLFVDGDARVRLFRGVNVVYKLPPFHPELETFDPATSLCEEDMRLLSEEWGLNMVRLGLMWTAVDTGAQPGAFNTTYLDIMHDLVTRLGEHGIYSLLDAHQDLLSPRLCGEGFPDFAVRPRDSAHAFPWPLPFSLPRDPHTGLPVMEECKKHLFFAYNAAEAVGTAWEELYTNATIQSWFAEHWRTVARRFAAHDAVLGYELLNEPFPGYVEAHPGNVLRHGEVDGKWLKPMYERLHAAIRSVDDDTIIFYEPSVMETFVYQRTGFDVGPGGTAYNDRQAFSYHIYCDVDMNSTGDPKSPWLCEKLDDSYWKVANEDIRRVGGGSFLTEYGAFGNGETSAEVIDQMLDRADEHLHGWAWWEYKGFNDPTTHNQHTASFFDVHGHVQARKVASLARTYAPAIAGKPSSVRMAFDRPTGAFRLSYAHHAASTAPTEVFLAEKIHYPRGFVVDVAPSGATWKHVRANRIHVDASALADGTPVVVSIAAK